MNKCFFSKKRNREVLMSSAGIALAGIVLTGCAIKQMATSLVSFPVVLLAVLGVMIGLLGVFLYAVETREYALTEKGFCLRYLKCIVTWYDWADIGSVCVCDVNHAPKNDSYFDLVIRLERGTKKQNVAEDDLIQLDPKSRWRKQEHNLWHYRDVILFEYSPIRLVELLEASKMTATYSVTNLAKDYFEELNTGK